MTESHAPRSIPEFADRDEEAEFWDTHDITDYLDELTPVHVRFAKNLSEGVTGSPDGDSAVEPQEIAKDRG